jgi:ribosomal protein S18 acetylase RimI-like enzyme
MALLFYSEEFRATAPSRLSRLAPKAAPFIIGRFLNGAHMTGPQVFTCRVADENDKSGIWEILFEVAPDIPARVEKPEEQESLKNYISEWVDVGSSWVAVDSDGLVIGFVLSKPDNGVRLNEKNNALNLPYIGVSKKWQKRGVLTSLLEKLKAQGEPLTVSVLNANKSNMIANLEKADFAKESRQDPKQTYLRWNPSNPTRVQES